MHKELYRIIYFLYFYTSIHLAYTSYSMLPKGMAGMTLTILFSTLGCYFWSLLFGLNFKKNF